MLLSLAAVSNFLNISPVMFYIPLRQARYPQFS